MVHELPKLLYDYSALEPHIDAQTMEIHYSKHHQGYVNNLNSALESYTEFSELPLEELLSTLDSLPEEIRTAVQNNGGGHYNHSLFWESMSKDGGGEPSGDLAEAIRETFGDFTAFQEEFSTTATTRFGSGWAWLSADGSKGLTVHSTPNQDTPLAQALIPLLGIDVWEHAYYLNYQNKRADYVQAWWNVVNWNEVLRRYKNM